MSQCVIDGEGYFKVGEYRMYLTSQSYFGMYRGKQPLLLHFEEAKDGWAMAGHYTELTAISWRYESRELLPLLKVSGPNPKLAGALCQFTKGEGDTVCISVTVRKDGLDNLPDIRAMFESPLDNEKHRHGFYGDAYTCAFRELLGLPEYAGLYL